MPSSSRSGMPTPNLQPMAMVRKAIPAAFRTRRSLPDVLDDPPEAPKTAPYQDVAPTSTPPTPEPSSLRRGD